MSSTSSHVPVTLLELLSNTLIMHQTVPYLPISALLFLAATSKTFEELLYRTPGVFRYLDLSTVKGAAIPFAPIDAGGEVWRSQRMDEAVTEDDFYSGPLRGVFANLTRKNILQDVQTLILDGLSVPADLIWEIICEGKYNVRILSIREAKNLNEKKLMQVLRYCVRPSRPEGTPRLKGLYVFGPRDTHALEAGWSSLENDVSNVTGITSSEGAQLGMEWNQKSHHALSSALAADGDRWYRASGRMTTKLPATEWAETVRACDGLIAFDAVLCRGPRHDLAAQSSVQVPAETSERLSMYFLPPTIATVALGASGCAKCHNSPEGPAFPGGISKPDIPLLAPPPLHSSTVRAAQRPSIGIRDSPPLFVRCEACLRDRWCERCNKWWCEACHGNNETNLYTPMQKVELAQDLIAAGYINGKRSEDILKVLLGLCVEGCLVSEMMAGAGSGGMWG
ncbi:MAG: hypothetical protein M1830_005574 [Pleopsidium flavum]|nr:MAG: hypothetical protein M1830_005574 [Pleopsidium flavum]